MTCPACVTMCATSEAQLAGRLRNMEKMPDARPYACQGCGSQEWATSREMIKPEKPKKKWYQHPRIFHRLRIGYLVTGGFCFGSAVMSNAVGGPGWLDLANMFIAGLNAGGVIYSSYVISANENIRRLKAAKEELHQLNQALIENRVNVIIAGMSDDDPPLAPRLH